MKKIMAFGNVLFLYLFYAFQQFILYKEDVLTKFTWNRFVQDNTKDVLPMLIGLIIMGIVLILSNILYLGWRWDHEEDGDSAALYQMLAKFLILVGHLLIFRPLVYLGYGTYGEKIMSTVLAVYVMAQICSGLYSIPVFQILNKEGKISRGAQISCSILSFLVGIDTVAAVWAYVRAKRI